MSEAKRILNEVDPHVNRYDQGPVGPNAPDDEWKFILHLSDWNDRDRALETGLEAIKVLAASIRSEGSISQAAWEAFYSQAQPTKGIEDATFFLDWENPVECVEEWYESGELD